MLRLIALFASFLFATPAFATCTIGQPGTTVTVKIGETGRSTLLHLPRDFESGRPAPLILLLHGSGGTGAQMLKNSALAESADRHGFIVVAPDAGIPLRQGFAWNIPGVPTVDGNTPGPDAANDVAYLKTVASWLAAQGCTDASRTYVTGLSGGGRMTSWLGCVAADRFAAIAPVVGLRAGNPLASDPQRPDPATCRPSRPMPVIAFAGDKDTTNPIQGGGAKYWQYTMGAAEARWASLNRCTAAPATRWVATGVYEERYSGCADDADVTARVTTGGGHSWVVDNDAMWAFLSRYRR